MIDPEVSQSEKPPLRFARQRLSNLAPRIGENAMSAAQVVELQPLALAPLAAARLLSISKRSLSRLIASGKIVARKEGTRTLVDFASLKAYYAGLPIKQRQS
jgi:excisionase family DNA binding protein